MVELFIWILHSYYDDLDVAKEGVFAMVHFTLFYTAIFNAFQTVIVAIFAFRLSRQLWVQTETLELNHYVEIREEFQRVKEVLETLKGKQQQQSTKDNTKEEHQDHGHTTHGNGNQQAERPPHDIDIATGDNEADGPDMDGIGPTERTLTSSGRGSRSQPQSSLTSLAPVLDLNRASLSRMWKSLVYQIRYPHLKNKYNQLLVQVRFHELRVHLLQAYGLPLKLKVSDYLMRSELNVLIRLVHVSIIAWLLLTGATNLLYFVMGVVAYETTNSEIVGTALGSIFFASMGGFVLIAIALHVKMNSIFHAIMKQKLLWDVLHDEEQKQQLAQKQLDLFWFGEPKIVIAAIQFMQFGYAIALSVVLIFQHQISEGVIDVYWYIVVIAIAYSVFVYVVAKVIPRYTLCTSLGQLVDERRLNETLSAFQLEEAKRQQLEQLEFNALVTSPIVQMPSEILDDVTSVSSVKSRSKTPDTSSIGQGIKSAFSSFSRGATTTPPVPTTIDKSFSEDRESAELMAELVKLDTNSLRTNLPASEREALSRREARRRNRHKSVSDGVSAMARMGREAFGSFGPASTERPRQVKDDSMLSQRKTFLVLPPIVPEEVTPSNAMVPPVSEDLKPDDTTLENLRQRRRTRGRRRKSVSDGVALMSALIESEPTPMSAIAESEPSSMSIIPEAVPEEHPVEPEKLHESRQVVAQLKEKAAKATTPDPIDAELKSKPPEDTIIPARPSEDDAYVSPSLKSYVEKADETLKEMQQSFLSADDSNADKAPEHDTDADSNVLVPHDATKSDIDEGSIPSTASVGGLSDSDDIPEVDPLLLKQLAAGPQMRLTLRQRFRAYYMSKRFVLLSNVFGTMVAFFLIGQRVESFLSSQGITNDSIFVSFDFPNKITFWILFTWFILFLITSTLIFLTLGNLSNLKSNKERSVFLAAVLDTALTLTCLSLFCAAEAQRCCIPSDDPSAKLRDLAGEEPGYPVYGAAEGLPACSCPQFGTRLYGGLGKIEPFVSLIALRIFRHPVARRLIKTLESSFSSEKDPHQASTATAPNEPMQMDPFDVFEESPDKDSGMAEEHGTIVELWQAAVQKYPAVVDKHGQFSGELLRAMLGVPIIDDPGAADNQNPDSAMTSTPKLSDDPLTIGKEYEGLSTHAQEIIIAGRVGRTVKTKETASPGRGSHSNLFRSSSNRIKGLTFEVDEEAVAVKEDVSSMFVSPNARLVRGMRRCDRKLLPILDKWTVVDVVITRYEIVYFDAVGVDEQDNAASNDTRQALLATKGGKGLRLCDVAEGRRVVGQLPLASIDSISVERELPHDTSNEEAPFFIPKVEYWAPETEHTLVARNWYATKQDTLKIHTSSGGTLCLRFYSDLQDAEAHHDRVVAENEEEGPLFKNTAFQWVQTIGRFCGPEQLKQLLPHFGDDTAEELRDYLKVLKNDDPKEPRHRRAASGDHLGNFFHLPRTISAVNLRQLATHHNANRPPDPPNPVRRSSSIGQDGKVAKARFRRSASLDESLVASVAGSKSSRHRSSRSFLRMGSSAALDTSANEEEEAAGKPATQGGDESPGIDDRPSF